MAGKKLSLVDKGILQILLCCREERGHTRQIDTLFLGKNPSKILHFRVHFYAILSPINKLSIGKKNISAKRGGVESPHCLGLGTQLFVIYCATPLTEKNPQSII